MNYYFISNIPSNEFFHKFTKPSRWSWIEETLGADRTYFSSGCINFEPSDLDITKRFSRRWQIHLDQTASRDPRCSFTRGMAVLFIQRSYISNTDSRAIVLICSATLTFRQKEFFELSLKKRPHARPAYYFYDILRPFVELLSRNSQPEKVHFPIFAFTLMKQAE